MDARCVGAGSPAIQDPSLERARPANGGELKHAKSGNCNKQTTSQHGFDANATMDAFECSSSLEPKPAQNVRAWWQSLKPPGASLGGITKSEGRWRKGSHGAGTGQLRESVSPHRGFGTGGRFGVLLGVDCGVLPFPWLAPAHCRLTAETRCES